MQFSLKSWFTRDRSIEVGIEATEIGKFPVPGTFHHKNPDATAPNFVPERSYDLEAYHRRQRAAAANNEPNGTPEPAEK